MATKKTPRSSATKKTATKKKAAKKTAGKKKTTRKAGAKKAGKKAGRSAGGDKAAAAERPGVRVSREIAGRTLTLETGYMAKQADGAVVARYGETTVLATAQSAKARPDIDFFPLTVDYREKYAAAGKFPGGFFKREARPTTREVLTCRIIDRSIRPLFPDGYKAEVQVLSQVLSTDRENDSDIVAAIGSFAALAISSIPHDKILGAVRMGLVDGEVVVNPTWSTLQAGESELNLIVAAHEQAIVMVEAGAEQVEEEPMLEALERGHEVCREVAEMIDELVELAGKPKQEFEAAQTDGDLAGAVRKDFGRRLKAVPFAEGTKHERGEAKKALLDEVVEAFPPPDDASDKDRTAHEKAVKGIAYDLIKVGEREGVLKGKRSDGRGWADIRPIHVEVGLLPRVHGSALFTRGETQALATATLGTEDDKQIIDGIYPEDRKRFLLHYNFPPFCVGEVRRVGGVGRREIGHGALAERALSGMLPDVGEFPYSIRITSEILESNGSSSMASVCAGTLSLMDAGVPLKQPVAGIAMGLVVEGKKVAILSDILGSEDHCGDMDFKVAGTGKGITALQMDIKCEGLSREVLEEALEQARIGRLHILREMLSVIRKPRESISANAPRLVTVSIPSEKIGLLIGPGGRNVRELQETYEVRVNIGNDGTVQIAGIDAAKVEECMQRVQDLTAEVELGQVYKGRVTAIKEFGAFVEILPGQEGLVHVSELSDEFIRAVTDVVRIGDEVEVKVIEIDDFGKVKLSRKALLGGGEGAGDGGAPRGRREERPERGRREERPERGRRDRGDRGPREERPEHGRRDREDRGDRDDRGWREDRPRRGREERGGRPPRDRDDLDDRPRGRGRGRDREDREERPVRDREERPGRDREERYGRGRDRDRDDRGAGRGRDRDDRGAGRGRDRDDRYGRGRPRDDREERGGGGDREDRESRGPRGRGRGRERDDREERGREREERPASRGRDRDDVDDRPLRARRAPAEGGDRDAPRGRRDRDDRDGGRGGPGRPRRGGRDKIDDELSELGEELESPTFGPDEPEDSVAVSEDREPRRRPRSRRPRRGD